MGARIREKKTPEQPVLQAPPGGRAAFGTVEGLLFYLLLLALLLAVVYLGNRYVRGQTVRREAAKQQEVQAALPPRSLLATGKETPAESWSEEPVAPAPGPISDGPTVDWDHPDFRAGAIAFNDALAMFRRLQNDRSNDAYLKSIESQCRVAMEKFESCRDTAPAGLRIDSYIHQAYQLLSAARQMTLLGPAGGEGESAVR